MMAAAVKLEALWGTRVLAFDLTRESRNRLRIVVQPDGGIRVFAPERATDEEVVERVQRRGDWVARQLEQFESWRPRTPARQYVSGETHLFLGRQLRLRVVEGELSALAISGDRLLVSVPKRAARDLVQQRVCAWYAAQARRLLPQQYEAHAERWLRHGITPPRLMVRTLRSRWGSLTSSGNLVLNQDLIRASPRLSDYVIAHELAHVVHPDHGRQWQALLTRMMPDWRERKNELERQLL